MVAVAIVGAGALSAGASIFGAQSAANAQENAASQASATQMAMFQQMQKNLSPYMKTGASANAALTAQLPSLTAPVNMSQAALEQTPGYQFNLYQGEKSLQNSYAARGLGTSGAAIKGAENYATGLANSTYQNQFSNAVTNKQLAYNMLAGQQGLGENAAAGVGNAGISTGNSIASNTIGAGNAAGAADVASGNAVANGAGTAIQGTLLNNLLSGGGSSYFAGNNYGSADAASAAQAGIQSGLQMFPDGSIG